MAVLDHVPGVCDMQKDIIYRQAAVELAMKYCPDDDGAVQCDRDIRGLLDELENLPSAQPERKKGEWIRISPANIYECSKCGKNVMTDDISEYDFCHGCGADMRGTEND